jgi:hypothetical protein
MIDKLWKLVDICGLIFVVRTAPAQKGENIFNEI